MQLLRQAVEGPREGDALRKSGGEGCGESHRTERVPLEMGIGESEARMTQRLLSRAEQMAD